MHHKVDWLSFTVTVDGGENRRSHEMPTLINAALCDLHPSMVFWLFEPQTVEPTRGRKPYSLGWRFIDRHIQVYAHPHLPHALIEISGQGCDLLESEQLLPSVMAAALNRLTRLDIASDMLTETRPVDFINSRDVGRFKSNGFITSPSGETCYVGSRSSDRYARVYRYNPPHERSHLLRCEVSLRGMQARLTAQALLDENIRSVAAALGNVFGWHHPDWQPGASNEAVLGRWRPERHQGKTEYWVEAQVFPALVKLFEGRPEDLKAWMERLWNKAIVRDNER